MVLQKHILPQVIGELWQLHSLAISENSRCFFWEYNEV